MSASQYPTYYPPTTGSALPADSTFTPSAGPGQEEGPGAGRPRARHRAPRPKSRARKLFTRASAVGATLALPIIGASIASASGGGDGHTYTVEEGDTLSSIAKEKHIEGGWKKLYQANKKAIGKDPDNLQEGVELRLDVKEAVRPVQGGIKSAGFAQAGAHWSHEHSGVDLAVPTGTSVKAAMDGKVVTADWGGAFGNEIVVKHADGKFSHYAHLSKIEVKKDQSVKAGERIARSGSTGNSTGPHLHFEVRNTPNFGSAIDPIKWLAGHGVKL